MSEAQLALNREEARPQGLALQDITITYRNGLTALHDVNFTIPTGTVTALVGINGSGKSTLFKAIMGFLPAARGRVSILGQQARSP